MGKKSYVIAVNMMPYGIKMVIKSTTEFVDEIIEEFEALVERDSNKAIGYLPKLKTILLKEDAFFNKYPKAAYAQKERWGQLCDLCVDYAALNAVLNKEPIYLVHPDQYEEQRSRGLVNLSSPGGLDLVPDVPITHMSV